MSTNAIAATKPVEITDPTLLGFHNQREIANVGTEQQIERSLPQLQKTNEEIVSFGTTVRERGKLLQEERVRVPSQQDLNTERDGYNARYHGFKEAYEKAGLLAESILGTIRFLTPVQRNWHVEQSLKDESPGLYAQTKRSEEICLEHIGELNKSHQEVVSLRTKLLTAINDKSLTWSLERFCGIVDNHGKPLPWYNRAYNYVSPYIVSAHIPKPAEQGAQPAPATSSPTLTTAGSKEGTPAANTLAQTPPPAQTISATTGVTASPPSQPGLASPRAASDRASSKTATPKDAPRKEGTLPHENASSQLSVPSSIAVGTTGGSSSQPPKLAMEPSTKDPSKKSGAASSTEKKVDEKVGASKQAGTATTGPGPT